MRRRHHLYTTSQHAWAAMYRAIEGATASVYLEMYIFEDSPPEHDFVALLESKARAGVRVKVILDAVGSFSLPQETRMRLIGAGVELLFYRYLLHRTHRKLLIVDEQTAFVGGVNIGRRFSEWDDLVLRMTGAIVESVVRSFARAYEACGGTDRTLLTYARRTILSRTKTWFVEHGLRGTHYTLRTHYTTLIEGATEALTLVTPYFFPAPWLIAALGRACKRGVRVEVLVPHTVDIPLLGHLNRYYAAMLTQLGATFYLHPLMNHAKAVLRDGRVAIIGSNNLDSLSFDRNAEAGVWCEDKQVIAALERTIAQWKERSTTYDPSAHPGHRYDGFIVRVLRFLTPML